MEPELEKWIAEQSKNDYSEDELRLIFVRNKAREAFEQNKIKEETISFFKRIVEIGTASTMQRDDIGKHIGNLEKIRHDLAAFTQGLMQGYTKDEQPKCEARRRKQKAKEAREKAAKNKDSKVAKATEALLALAQSGAIKDLKKKASESSKKPATKGMETCPKCKEQVYKLKFHTC